MCRKQRREPIPPKSKRRSPDTPLHSGQARRARPAGRCRTVVARVSRAETTMLVRSRPGIDAARIERVPAAVREVLSTRVEQAGANRPFERADFVERVAALLRKAFSLDHHVADLAI